jgi:hypothetical protein
MPWCGCATCNAARDAEENAADEAHQAWVGALLGFTEDVRMPTTQTNDVDTVETPPDTTTETTLIRHPGIPTTVEALAARGPGEAIEILEARIAVLETARKRAIRITSPEDWLLFRRDDGRITGYLQDAGCERIRDITGIEVFDVGEPVRVAAHDARSFMYLIRGSGRSKLTGQVVEAMEGGRESTDDFCRDKKGAQLELAVRKAARANLDGGITRELAGLKSVPLEELQAAWQGTAKNWEHCPKGRGFGTKDERLGATREGVPDVDPPICPVCKIPLVYRGAKGNRAPFYGCRNYETHPEQKVIVNAAKWLEEQKRAATNATEAP